MTERTLLLLQRTVTNAAVAIVAGLKLAATSRRSLGLTPQQARKLSCTVLAILVLCYCLHPARFASHYSYVKVEDIESALEPTYPLQANTCILNIANRTNSNQISGSVRPKLLYPELQPKEDSREFAQKLNIEAGGYWKPRHCQPRYNVAIVLPYRNRQSQLTIFLYYIHPFLQAQNLEYRIFVVEQSMHREFNRAKLFNVGFVEANKVGQFHCFIFQDIDLIPQNLDNIYACTKTPRHMSSSVNTFRYNLPYTGLFGGAIAITKEQFLRVNGFSNVYFGWGAEDDDFHNRLQNKGLMITRFGPDVSQYYMLTHKKEPPSSTRFINLENGSKRFDVDGINDLEYRVLDQKLQHLYSWILVSI